MILTELYNLYDRLASDPESAEKLPREGMSVQKISFVVILSHEGDLIDIQDAKVAKELPPKKKGGDPKIEFRARELIVPGTAHPSGAAPTPRFFWDSTAYIFGYYPVSAKKSDKDKIKAREVLFPEYRKYHREFVERCGIEDDGARAVVSFLKKWNPNEIPEEIRTKLDSFGDNFGVFRIQGSSRFVHESSVIQDAWQTDLTESDASGPRGACLISGVNDVPLVATVDTKIKLAGTAVGGGAIATFNASAYESYGKTQTYNSPLSKDASFKAYNALNYLIADSRHHFKLAGTTVVFWTEKKTQTENLMPWLFGGETPPNGAAQDDALLQKLEAFWKAVSFAGDPDLSGVGDDVTTPFYMLGIEANSARIVVRFWQEGTLGDLVLRLRKHQEDLKIEKRFAGDADVIPLYMLLRQTARDNDGIPPLLGAELLRAVINGIPYPKSLYQLTLNRINLSHDKDGYDVGSKVSYLQAAIVKAFLTRNTKTGELTMSLNTENKNPAYLLGRLFATLEKTQNESSGGVNAGVGDKFYSSASATPRIVFPTLLDLFRKHVSKLGKEKPGLAIVREQLVGEILDGINSIDGFPGNLSLEERGLFALGYYQQMREFFRKKEDSSVVEENK